MENEHRKGEHVPVFTGIVEATARVLDRPEQGGRLTVERPALFHDLREGASIAVAGTCLTLSGLHAGSMTFHVVSETLRCTTLGELRPGQWVNLERALRADGRLDGHVVQGHVEGVAPVVRVERTGSGGTLVVRIPDALQRFVVSKGSIAIDGVSLTVASLVGDQATVALIPATLERTTLGLLQAGDRVNIETDILARYLFKRMCTDHASMHSHALRSI